jgi:hypothetical protein
VVQKLLKASAEVVESGFFIEGLEKTVFGTPTATGKKHVTIATIPGQGAFLCGAEGELFF